MRLQDCRIAGLQEGLEIGESDLDSSCTEFLPSFLAILQSCNSAMSRSSDTSRSGRRFSSSSRMSPITIRLSTAFTMS